MLAMESDRAISLPDTSKTLARTTLPSAHDCWRSHKQSKNLYHASDELPNRSSPARGVFAARLLVMPDADGTAPAPADPCMVLLLEFPETAGRAPGAQRLSLPPVEAAAAAEASWLLCCPFFCRLLGGSMAQFKPAAHNQDIHRHEH